jgi:peptide-methionine (S)-S-oxide reductase
MMTRVGAAVVGIALVLAVAVGVKTMVFGQARTEKLPAPVLDEQHPTAHSETAVLAGGCFWGVQTTFERIKGVEKTWRATPAGPRRRRTMRTYPARGLGTRRA